MSEESKYYTPTEVELFEAIINGQEVFAKILDENEKFLIKAQLAFYHLDDPGRRLSWFLMQNNLNPDGIYHVDPSLYEIKHLDRADMLSLGLIDGDDFAMSCWMFPTEKDKDFPDMEGFQIHTQFPEELGKYASQHVTIYGDDERAGKIVFEGTINNLSEFKRVLKQIGAKS